MTEKSRYVRRIICRWLCCAAFALLVLTIVYCYATKEDPIVQSRRLSSWFEQVLSSDREAAAAASKAIAQLGTNAYPYLVRDLTSTDGQLRRWLGRRIGYTGGYIPASMRQLRACVALRAFGGEVQILGPHVTNLFVSPIPSVRQAAFETACAMSLPNIEAALESSLSSDSSLFIRILAAKSLIKYGYEPAVVMDTLVTNIWNRGASTATLRRVAESLKGMSIPLWVFQAKLPEYATSEFSQVRHFVAVAAPICLPERDATNLLMKLSEDAEVSASASSFK